AVPWPEVEQAHRAQSRERGPAVHKVELSQQRRDAIAHDPGVKAHADAPEGLWPHVPNDAHPERDPDDETREDVREQTGALEREHPGRVVRRGGEGRFREPDESEAGA